MYVSPYNNLNDELHVSEDIQASWTLLWQEANDEFDSMLQNDFDLSLTLLVRCFLCGRVIID